MFQEITEAKQILLKLGEIDYSDPFNYCKTITIQKQRTKSQLPLLQGRKQKKILQQQLKLNYKEIKNRRVRTTNKKQKKQLTRQIIKPTFQLIKLQPIKMNKINDKNYQQKKENKSDYVKYNKLANHLQKKQLINLNEFKIKRFKIRELKRITSYLSSKLSYNKKQLYKDKK